MPNLINAFFRTVLQYNYSDDEAARETPSRTPSKSFTNGSGDNQANRAYYEKHTIAASGTLVLNLTTGLVDFNGNAIAATKLKALLIEHLDTTTATSITIGGGTNPLFGTQIVALPIVNGSHQSFVFPKGYTVASGSADRITITNADGTNQATVRITMLTSQ